MSLRRLFCCAALALSTAAATACAPPAPRVARGEAITTGDTLYDDFFTAVREVRSEALAARTDEMAAHAATIKALGLSASATPLLAVDEAGQRAKLMAERGVLLHMEITPDPKFVAARTKGDKADLGADGEALVKALEGGARSALDLRRKLAAVAVRAAALEKKRIDLRARMEETFRAEKQARRDEILVELDAAQGVLADAGEKTSQAAAAAARFVVELAQAVETGAIAAMEAHNAKFGKGPKRLTLPAAAPPVVAAATPPATPPKAAPAKRAAPPPRQAAPAGAAAPPKSKAKGGDDFEP